MKQYFLIFCLLGLISCQRSPSPLEYALQSAGSNRPELEKVLTHYKEDALKLKAAEFLISNMRGFHTSHGRFMDTYYQVMDSLHRAPEQMQVLALRDFYDSVFKRYEPMGFKKEYDLEYITSDYLIQRIENAFTAWESPWAKELSFEDFCEYILPYRIGTEVLEDWEKDYRHHFQYAFNNIDLSPDTALMLVCDSLSARYKTNSYTYPANMPTVKPSVLKYMRVAPCSDFANLFVFIGRTFGIPTAIDFIPQWANHASGHEWSAVVYKGKTLDFMIGENTPLNGHLKKFNYKYPKVFRKTFAIQPNSLAVLAYDEELPPLFRNPRIKDVTKEYIPVQNLSINDLKPNKKRGKRVYMAVFDDKNWVPIAWGNIKNNNAIIHDMGGEAVYLPVYYIDNTYFAAQYPLKVDEVGNFSYLKPDKKNVQSVVLKRKYMEDRAWDFVEFLKGGKFQLSDNRDFINAKEFHIPDTIGYNYQTFHIEDDHKYRYMRYVPKPYSDGNIAEIELYNTNGEQIKGNIIGTYKFTGDTVHTMEKVFDGNTLSYAICDRTQNNQWVGLDLKEPVEISKILYLPRSDDNFIKENELYELFYWDDKWVSLGKQVGSKQTQALTYENVPSNALLLLKNLTKGVEERIFTYENEKQVWW